MGQDPERADAALGTVQATAAAAAAAHEKSRKGRRTDAAPKKSSQGQAFDGRSLRKSVTAAGRAELAPPHIFDDLFKKEKLMLTNAEIDAHPLLDRDQRVTCKARRNLAKKEHRPFTMLEFAEVSLRETGNDYAALTDQGGLWAAWSDDALRRAAILYVYEAVKAGPPIVAETAGERGTLRDIELLASHGVAK